VFLSDKISAVSRPSVCDALSVLVVAGFIRRKPAGSPVWVEAVRR
jgi:hypothetical protein